MNQINADQPILALSHITKRFGGNIAVNDVSLQVMPGEVLALLGENGAGKSTIIKVLAGVYPRDGGDIQFRGTSIASAAAIKSDGLQPIAFIHQDLGLIEWMTVAENMALVMGFPRRFGLIDWRAIRQRASQALQDVGIALDPDARVFELSRTEKSLLAIARAVAVNAELLVLDEPTASLPANDVRHLFSVINRLRAKKVGMIYVTHRLDEVIDIADRVCVMRDGRYVAGGKTADYSLRDLVQLIVGEAMPGDQREPLPAPSSPVLQVKNVTVGDIGPVSFSLQAGEMLALAGLRGAGQEEIGRLLFGLRQCDSGEIQFRDAPYHASSPQQAMAQGVSLVAGDRTNESLVMSMSVRENLFINPCASGHKLFSRYSRREEIGASWWKVQLFDVRPKNVNIDISALSGGNQQKVVMARWMHLGAPLLILEDPTAGVDVGARAEIYHLLNKSLAEGVAVLVISNDFEEIAHICNRALVFNRGSVVGELKNQQVSFANLLELASASAGETTASA
ncbi:sugar ABC transporter ATP-binding protein [Pectobacterium parmentieri]|uniref:Sugar ABC transporter ATP-binding protein n=2 Tax=Pectobacterium parmentieri TaxID=1905730 RepID=A0A8B3FI22_PECPM|nr:sugar ABC transporter ATP-binding protein [Pectobacterium parmentieri]ACX89616.1 ABC transporter related protein [Pectobacterium parmentieri WPP163]AOR61545.1 sugar ABC transporter ATP-binding protein [Pectobacterium parmentieri]AYH03009.1 sugar ABC transporter ATP-binding protein [Pectobacterium parmentieri]AYH11796.1 sugar ABC transporter ATP-binding protein [Pectobacterium parmentieri]AYH17483.1 sugar ABC transporter ATP-binding protein [Pectobacterium parmentieri]